MKIMIVARDAGGANSLLPVIENLSNYSSVELFVFASTYAARIWEEAKIPFVELETNTPLKKIQELFFQIQPQAVLSGTSEHSILESKFWQLAQEKAVPSYTIIDHWSQFRERFVINNQLCTPTYIFVMDQATQEEFIKLGFNPESIIVSGQPYFDKIADYKSKSTRKKFLENNHLPDRKIITFASDVVEKSHGNTLGYTEKDILGHLLSSIFFNQLPDYQLIIKLHPKEDLDNLTEIVNKFSLPIPIKIVKNIDSKELIYHSELVISMFSMLLFEGFLMGKKCLSLQIGAHTFFRYGHFEIPTVQKIEELDKMLESILDTNQPQTRKIFTKTQATEKIVNTILCTTHF